MTPITFSNNIDKKTFIRFSMQILFQSKFFQIICAICFLTIIYVIGFYGLSDPVSATWVSIIVTAVFLYVFRFFLLANYRYSSTPIAKEDIFWIIDETGIETKAESAGVTLSWGAITKITENKSWVLFWYNKCRFLYFQKDLITADDLKAIKTAFSQSKRTSAK